MIQPPSAFHPAAVIITDPDDARRLAILAAHGARRLADMGRPPHPRDHQIVADLGRLATTHHPPDQRKHHHHAGIGGELNPDGQPRLASPPQPDTARGWLTISEAATRTGIPARTIRAHAPGMPGARRTPGGWLLPVASLATWHATRT